MYSYAASPNTRRNFSLPFLRVNKIMADLTGGPPGPRPRAAASLPSTWEDFTAAWSAGAEVESLLPREVTELLAVARRRSSKERSLFSRGRLPRRVRGKGEGAKRNTGKGTRSHGGLAAPVKAGGALPERLWANDGDSRELGLRWLRPDVPSAQWRRERRRRRRRHSNIGDSSVTGTRNEGAPISPPLVDYPLALRSRDIFEPLEAPSSLDREVREAANRSGVAEAGGVKGSSTAAVAPCEGLGAGDEMGGGGGGGGGDKTRVASLRSALGTLCWWVGGSSGGVSAPSPCAAGASSFATAAAAAAAVARAAEVDLLSAAEHELDGLDAARLGSLVALCSESRTRAGLGAGGGVVVGGGGGSGGGARTPPTFSCLSQVVLGSVLPTRVRRSPETLLTSTSSAGASGVGPSSCLSTGALAVVRRAFASSSLPRVSPRAFRAFLQRRFPVLDCRAEAWSSKEGGAEAKGDGVQAGNGRGDNEDDGGGGDGDVETDDDETDDESASQDIFADLEQKKAKPPRRKEGKRGARTSGNCRGQQQHPASPLAAHCAALIQLELARMYYYEGDGGDGRRGLL